MAITRYSSRVPADLRPNRFALALEALRARGARLLDLTESNPTRAGVDYPDSLLAPLADPAGLAYQPRPFGLESARRAVSGDYERRGLRVDWQRVVLTASTSEAYSLLFKLLCDPGDEVLIPHPSYPLFEHLTRLDAVVAVPYQLEFHGAWSIDLDSLREAVTPRTRVVLVVSPNNPTGSFLTRDDLESVSAVAEEHGLALVGDEVFADYGIQGSSRRAGSVLEGMTNGLVFSLGGLSKTVGLPQLKLGWIAAGGEPNVVQAALDRLEIICDTYLSVATPVQQATGALLAGGAAVRRQIVERITRNHQRLTTMAAAHPACRVLPAEGGWYAVVQVPATRTEESLVLQLLEEEQVIVHPGYFYDFPREAFLVLSLLPEPQVFDEAGERLFARVSLNIEP